MRSTRFAVVCVMLLHSGAVADPVDDYVRSQIKARNFPAVSIAVVKAGRLIKAEGYGLASTRGESLSTCWRNSR
jgi:hypothetical protein